MAQRRRSILFVGALDGFVLVPVVGAFVLGLDWKLVRRLRPLPFASGLLVVAAVPGAGSAGVAAAVAWLVLALGALANQQFPTLGGYSIDDFEICAHDLGPHPDIDGLLGWDFLRHFDIDIRPRLGVLRVTPA